MSVYRISMCSLMNRILISFFFLVRISMIFIITGIFTIFNEGYRRKYGEKGRVL
jgi:hypothetical protein